MLRRGFRRLGIAFGVICALTSVISLTIGALAHASLDRALAVGFYVAGAAVLVGCFVLGLRGPLRADWGDGAQPEMPLPRRGVPMPRRVRKATPDERTESKRNSLALFALGIVLIVIAAAFDPNRHAF